MVKLADIQISVPNPTSTAREDRDERISCPTTVDSNGLFTVTLPEHLVELAKAMTLPAGVSCDQARVNTRLQGKVLETLKVALTDLLKAAVSPEVTVERIIRYNVESHIAFVEAPDGTIFPNGAFEGAQYEGDGRWADGKLYGHHNATNPARNGYSCEHSTSEPFGVATR